MAVLTMSEELLLNNEWIDLDDVLHVGENARRDDFGPFDHNDSVTVMRHVVADPIMKRVDRDVRGTLGHKRVSEVLEAMRGAPKVTEESLRDLLDAGPMPNVDEHAEMGVRWRSTVDYFEDVTRRFARHNVAEDQSDACDVIVRSGLDMALTMIGLCEDSAERDHAIDCIEMAVMWATLRLRGTRDDGD